MNLQLLLHRSLIVAGTLAVISGGSTAWTRPMGRLPGGSMAWHPDPLERVTVPPTPAHAHPAAPASTRERAGGDRDDHGDRGDHAVVIFGGGPWYYDPYEPYWYGGAWYGPWWYDTPPPRGRAPRLGSAEATTEVHPGSAEVIVDGQPMGSARRFSGTWHELWLQPGRHEIELTAPGYQTLRLSVDAAPGRLYHLQYDLAAGHGIDPRSTAPSAS